MKYQVDKMKYPTGSHPSRLRRFLLPAVAAVILTAGSCRDYLSVDQYFSDELRLDTVFLNPRYLEAYMWGASTDFPDEAAIFGNSYTPGPLATDEAFTLQSSSGINFVLGNITADNIGASLWGQMYGIIRKCNNIFANIGGLRMDLEDRTRVLSYTRFIRAYAYCHLLMQYGPPILLGDEVVNVNLELAAYDRSRATFDEAVDYICGELEKAAVGMPQTQQLMDFGRPTKGAAWGLVARLRLIQASPLFNGGVAAEEYFGRWIRSGDGAHYVSQTYDERRWAVAAAAARRVIRTDLYDLYTVPADASTPELPVQPSGVGADQNFGERWPAGAAGIDHYRSYSELFSGEAPAVTNPEYVWGRNSTTVRNNTRLSFPLSIGGNNGGVCLTQKVIDAYLMKDGRTITQAMGVAGGYSEDGFISQGQFFSGYRLNTGVSNMYANREMRFYASVGFSECHWSCLSAVVTEGTNLSIGYYFDSANGKSGDPGTSNYPVTGYVLKKYIHPDDSWLASSPSSRRTDKVFPIIRYAEILLAYAEALNNLTSMYVIGEGELEGLDPEYRLVQRDQEEIRSSFNRVRYRAGLPGLNDQQLGDPDEVQRQIERERMVELLCENHRYFDVRRWGIYETTEREPIVGMNTESPKSAFYQRTIPNTPRIQQRKVDRKMIFMPLSKTELKRLPSCDQNPGWE